MILDHTYLPFSQHLGVTSGSEPGEVSLSTTEGHEGLPGYVHGGVLAALCDGAAWQAATADVKPDVTAFVSDLHVRFLRPVPLGAGLWARFQAGAATARQMTSHGLVTGWDGTVHAEAHAAIRLRYPRIGVGGR